MPSSGQHIAAGVTNVAKMAEAAGEQVLGGNLANGDIVIRDVGGAASGGDSDVDHRDAEPREIARHLLGVNGGDDPVRLPSSQSPEIELTRSERSEDPGKIGPRVGRDAAYGVGEEPGGDIDDQSNSREPLRQ